MDVRQRDRDDPPDPSLPAVHIPVRNQRSSLASTSTAWRPEAGAGQIIGAGLFLVALVAVIVALQRAGDSAGLLRGFWILAGLASMACATGIAALVARLRTISYRLESAELVVSAVGLRLAVPYHDIVDVVFRPRDLIDTGSYERYWPGFYDSRRLTSEGDWRSVATTPPAERVRIRLRTGVTIAISPERPVLFVEALQGYRRGAVTGDPVHQSAIPAPAQLEITAPEEPDRQPAYTPQMPPETRPGPIERAWSRRPVAIDLFRERIVRGDRAASNLLALNLIALIVLITVATWRSDAVNSPVPVHWDASDQPTWLASPDGFWVFEGIWIYPLTAAAVIAVNAALATLAAAAGRLPEARVLLAASFVVTLILLIGIWRATGVGLPMLG